MFNLVLTTVVCLRAATGFENLKRRMSRSIRRMHLVPLFVPLDICLVLCYLYFCGGQEVNDSIFSIELGLDSQRSKKRRDARTLGD